MALNHRDISLTREDVYQWLQEYDGQRRPTKRLRDFINDKLDGHNLRGQKMNTRANDSLGDETELVDLILMDLDSYA